MVEQFQTLGSKSFMALVSRVTKETACVEESIAGSGTRAEPLEAAAQSVATGISTVLLWLADAICHCFLMLALLRPSRRQERTEVGSKAPPAVAKSSPTAAKLGCAFPHSAERIVDELGHYTLKTVEICRKTLPAFCV